MKAGQFRSMAREKLNGKWGKAAILMLVFGLINFAIAFGCEFVPIVGSLVWYIISPVLSVGLLFSWYKLMNNEELGYLDFLTVGFEKFGKIWGVLLRVALKYLVPVALLVIGTMGVTVSSMLPIIGRASSGMTIAMLLFMILELVGLILIIPVQYKYMFCFNELRYSPEKSAKEIVNSSGEIMIGKRVGIFWLQLTFIGWILLSCLGFGIPVLWVVPYMQIASILYYDWASGRMDSSAATNDVIY